MLKPDSGSIELGAFVKPEKYGATLEYLHRIKDNFSLGAGGSIDSDMSWEAKGFLRYEF